MVFTLLLVTGFFGTGGGCPSGTQSDIEAARFALDRCNPADSDTAADCQEAVDLAEGVLADDPNNVDAGMLAASGRLGLAGIDFLQFASELLEAQNDDTADFKQFRDLVDKVETDNARTIDLDQLRSSVTVLAAALTGLSADSDLNSRAFFQLGIHQTIETFVLPTKLVVFDAGGEVDPSSIDDDVAEILRANFIDGDDNLLASDTDDPETLDAMREGYCLCVENAPGGYSAACVRDLMVCELSDTGTEDTEQDYDGDGVLVGDRTNDCDALTDANADVETCKDENTN